MIPSSNPGKAAITGPAGDRGGGGRAARRYRPDRLVDELGRDVTALVPEAAVGEHPELANRVVLLTMRQAKGLEFDTVLVVDPERIVGESPLGRSDLHVALTRATQRFGVISPR